MRTTLFRVITQRAVVILTDVSKKPNGPIIKKNWTNKLSRNVGKDCHRSLRNNLEGPSSHLLSVTYWQKSIFFVIIYSITTEKISWYSWHLWVAKFCFSAKKRVINPWWIMLHIYSVTIPYAIWTYSIIDNLRYFQSEIRKHLFGGLKMFCAHFSYSLSHYQVLSTIQI